MAARRHIARCRLPPRTKPEEPKYRLGVFTRSSPAKSRRKRQGHVTTSKPDDVTPCSAAAHQFLYIVRVIVICAPLYATVPSISHGRSVAAYKANATYYGHSHSLTAHIAVVLK